MKQNIIFFIVFLLTSMVQVSDAQCLPNDTIANQNTTGVGVGSICGIVPCENLNFLDGDTATFYTNIGCRKIISLKDSIDGINLGNVSVCETIYCTPTFLSVSGQPVLNRSFKITPTNNGKAYVSLYILQWDIDEYNVAAFPSWPILDPMSNLSVMQFDTTLVLGTPVSSMTYIPNSSITSTYDPLQTAWTISFPVDSFSTFYFSTPVTIEPMLVSNIDADTFITLSPNPANDNINLEIEVERDGMTLIQITDVPGRVLKAVKFNLKKGRNVNNIDISTLQVGSYLVSIKNGKELKYSKVIIKE